MRKKYKSNIFQRNHQNKKKTLLRWIEKLSQLDIIYQEKKDCLTAHFR